MSSNRDKKISVTSKTNKKANLEINIPGHEPGLKTMSGGFSQFKE